MKPRIKIFRRAGLNVVWRCEGKASDGYNALAFGMTPQKAYEGWKAQAHIPF